MKGDLDTPCKGCVDREVGCHGKCSYYNDWKARCAERKKKEQDEQMVNNAIASGYFMRHKRRHSYVRSERIR